MNRREFIAPSHFQRQVEYARNLYFNLSDDDLLKGFRRDAGLPAPGNDLKGWTHGRADATKHEQGTGRFRPLYEVAERLPYRVYFDVDKPRFW